MKKIIILMMAITMLFALSVIASADPVVTIGSATVTQGTGEQTVTIPLSITGIADVGGIEAISGKLYFDTGITWTDTEKVDPGLAESDLSTSSKLQSGKKISLDSMEYDTTEGAFAEIIFTVPTDAAKVYNISYSDIEIYAADYMDFYPDDAEGTITVEAAAPAATLEATGKSLLLDGGIDAKVYFAYNGTDTLKINGVAAASDAKGYYGYVSVSPKDYADTVTFTATASDVETVVVTTSVAAIIDEYQETADGTLKALVDALEVYCAQADAYFNGGSADAVSATVSAATPSIENKAIDGISFNSTSLILRDKVVLRHYFNITAETDLTAYGVTLVELDDTHAYVEYANINAADLGNVITTTLTKGETMTISFAPLAYADLMQDDAELGNLVKALYLYSVAAAAYAA